LVRKRIALSIKQTEEAPARGTRPKGQAQGTRSDNYRIQKKEEDLSNLSVNDALAALKNKFKK
jgi:protein Tex